MKRAGRNLFVRGLAILLPVLFAFFITACDGSDDGWKTAEVEDTDYGSSPDNKGKPGDGNKPDFGVPSNEVKSRSYHIYESDQDQYCDIECTEEKCEELTDRAEKTLPEANGDLPLEYSFVPPLHDPNGSDQDDDFDGLMFDQEEHIIKVMPGIENEGGYNSLHVFTATDQYGQTDTLKFFVSVEDRRCEDCVYTAVVGTNVCVP